MRIANHSLYCHPLPLGHRFPMEKYSLLPIQIMREGLAEESDFFEPKPFKRKWAEAIHTKEYLDKLDSLELSRKEERRIGFPLSRQLVEREFIIAAGTIQNAIDAWNGECSLNIAGGTHHAYASHGEGFCLMNDIAIAANYLIEEYSAERIAVIDLDVHQGNGTAHLFNQHQKIYTFSMHGANNYPLHKEQSHLDIPLADGTKDADYLYIIQQELGILFQKVRPQMVFYQSGVDVLESDKLGRLALTKEGCRQRDRLVFEHCKQAEIGVAVSMGGGYSDRISDILEAHTNTFREARWVFG